MEDEVMEQIRTRLAAATSAATALAKSLDALDENTLQTLEFWLAKQEGEGDSNKCGKCHAQMPRGKQTSVCIACGNNKRPPLPNTPAYDFKVSFAFLQFLETIHPPLKSGGRRMWNPTVSIASGNPEPSASIADLPVESKGAETSIEEREVAIALEPVRHPEDNHMIDEDIYRSNSQENPPVDINGTIAGEDGEDGDEVDDLGEFQENLGENAVDPSHEIAEDKATLNGYSHTDLEASKVEKEAEVEFVGASSSGAVNTWDTNWGHAPSFSVDNVLSDAMLENSKHISPAAPQVPEYDLSIFESFGGFESKQGSVLPKTDIDAPVWDFQDKSLVNTRLASVRAVERFTSDTLAFTTLTDADSDSGDSSQEVLSPPKLPHDLFMGLGANNRHNNLLGPLAPHDLDDFQKVSASSHPLATLPTFQDPFSWPLDTLDAVSSQVVGGDVHNVESSSAAMLEISGQAAVDPFPWPLEEFGNGPSTAHTTIQQGSLDLIGASPRRSEGNIADPFSWPLDTSNQITPDVDLGGAIGPVSAQVNDTAEYDSDDWGEEDFVGSQAEPANEAQLNSDLDLHPSSSFSISFSSNIITGNNVLDKDNFFNDQSSPMPSAANNSPALPDGFANLGNGLESLVITEEQKVVVEEEDVFKSVQVKSFSFGDYNKKVDNIDDLFKRSLSIGNLKGKDMTEGDELLKALQSPSIPPPSSQQPEEDILNFLNLKPASIPGDSETLIKSSHVRSVSFDTVELVPDEQSDEMFQFFHTRSQSAGSSANKSSAVKDGDGNDIFDNTPQMPKTQDPVVNDDPFSFIHTTASPSVTVEVKPAINGDDDDDDDDFFEWKSAEMPAASAPFVEAVLNPKPPPGSSEPDLFQWGTPTTPSPSKPLANGSQSGLLSLAGGLLPSQIRSSSKEDDLFAALSRNSSNSGGVRTGQPAVPVESKLQPAAIEVHSPKLVDDSEDEFSDFVSTGALSSSSPPTAAQQNAGQTSQPAFDVSFFEAPQSDASEKRNQDFFGDLMGLNFTNA